MRLLSGVIGTVTCLCLLAAIAAPTAAAAGSGDRFPDGFLWGTAIAGFQSDMGAGAPSDPNSDWWTWVRDPSNVAQKVVSGDLPEQGPGFWTGYREDVDRARDVLGSSAFRFGIEWSRIFPRSTRGVDTSGGVTLADLQALDALADQDALARYRDLLQAIRARGMEPFVTLNHYTLPRWVHDPVAVRRALRFTLPDAKPRVRRHTGGWLEQATVDEFEKYAAYVAWKLGDVIDTYMPLNEPVVAAVKGYVNVPGVLKGGFPPGVWSFTGARDALLNQAAATVAAYDAVKAHDASARVGIVHNLIAFDPERRGWSLDARGTRDADQLFNRTFPNAVIRGEVDRNANGRIEPERGEVRPEWRGKADFFGVNYYFRSRVTGLPFSLSRTFPLLRFLPTQDYRSDVSPRAPRCPTTCTDFGWEIFPQGFRRVLNLAGSYGLPVYVTENGLADADDDQRADYLRSHLAAMRDAISDGVDVRGYLHWSLTDNFEWAVGYKTRFGLFAYDPVTQQRTARPSADVFRRAATTNSVP
jgi:beta-glucosidase/6-phospho-beta-glucosidase/beta-galactosidase